MTIDDAVAFLIKTNKLKYSKIKTFTRCWFRLCTTRAIVLLSGGAQRIKLASFSS
jgi:hypothetical protein